MTPRDAAVAVVVASALVLLSVSVPSFSSGRVVTPAVAVSPGVTCLPFQPPYAYFGLHTPSGSVSGANVYIWANATEEYVPGTETSSPVSGVSVSTGDLILVMGGSYNATALTLYDNLSTPFTLMQASTYAATTPSGYAGGHTTFTTWEGTAKSTGTDLITLREGPYAHWGINDVGYPDLLVVVFPPGTGVNTVAWVDNSAAATASSTVNEPACATLFTVQYQAINAGSDRPTSLTATFGQDCGASCIAPLEFGSDSSGYSNFGLWNGTVTKTGSTTASVTWSTASVLNGFELMDPFQTAGVIGSAPNDVVATREGTDCSQVGVTWSNPVPPTGLSVINDTVVVHNPDGSIAQIVSTGGSESSASIYSVLPGSTLQIQSWYSGGFYSPLSAGVTCVSAGVGGFLSSLSPLDVYSMIVAVILATAVLILLTSSRGRSHQPERGRGRSGGRP